MEPATIAVDARLDSALNDVTAVISRTDTKAELLLALAAALLIGIETYSGHPLPAVARIAGELAAATVLAAMVLLLLVVLPHLGGHDRDSFPYWARLSPSQIREAMTGDRRPERLAVLSVLAMRKYRGVVWAVRALLAALGLLAVAACFLLL